MQAGGRPHPPRVYVKYYAFMSKLEGKLCFCTQKMKRFAKRYFNSFLAFEKIGWSVHQQIYQESKCLSAYHSIFDV
jgi:hypothetical protein